VAVAFGLVAVWSVAQLAELDRLQRPTLTALALVANPWFIIGASSLTDAVWAIALALLGAVQAKRGRPVVAGALFGLAVGCRGSTALVVVAWLLAERTGRPADRPPWRSTLLSGGTAVAVGVVCFVPAWLAAGGSLHFLDTHFEFLGWTSHLGRWFTKNLVVMTIPGALALAVAVPGLAAALRRWSERTTVRFAVFVIAFGELLFLRLPFKPIHLLPVVAAAVLLVGASDRRWLLGGLVAAQVLGGAIGVTVARPDVPDRATAGAVELHLTKGPLVNDIACRLDDRRRGPWPDPVDPQEEPGAQARATENFACQSRAWRPGSAGGATGAGNLGG
jgi:hypothetical protein